MAIQNFLFYLKTLPDGVVFAIFFVENLLITMAVLVAGSIIRKKFTGGFDAKPYTLREWLWCTLTNIINTMVTYAGYLLWREGWISITFSPSVAVMAIHFIMLFFAMDLLMYIFHFLIHKTFLYRIIHGLHHEAVDPRPIDLFILHPVETFCFGGLWLVVLTAYAFNIYAIVLYLFVNVVFGLAGHLGFEIVPEATRKKSLFKYIGTSTFHHDHHRDVQHNFGFYTNLWDRIMRTHRDHFAN